MSFLQFLPCKPHLPNSPFNIIRWNKNKWYANKNSMTFWQKSHDIHTLKQKVATLIDCLSLSFVLVKRLLLIHLQCRLLSVIEENIKKIIFAVIINTSHKPLFFNNLKRLYP